MRDPPTTKGFHDTQLSLYWFLTWFLTEEESGYKPDGNGDSNRFLTVRGVGFEQGNPYTLPLS